MDEELTTQQVADLLGVSRRTVQAYVKVGKLVAHKTSQGRNVFLHSEVKTMLASFTPVKVCEDTCEAPCEDGVKLTFVFDPEKQMIVDIEQYEGLLHRHVKLETENRMLCEERDRAIAAFNPQIHVVVDRTHYEGLLLRLSQVETENRILREQSVKLIEEQSTKPWWRFWGKA